MDHNGRSIIKWSSVVLATSYLSKSYTTAYYCNIDILKHYCTRYYLSTKFALKC
jgi:hypothetical protein